MAATHPSVFVCGVTGNQGGAVARHLLKMHWGVHATVRNIGSLKATALIAAGARLTEGDWQNEDALKASLAGCSKIFLNLAVTPDDPDRERRQAASILKIARDSGVNQVVASTTLGVSLYGTEGAFESSDIPRSAHLEVFVKVEKDIEEMIANGQFDSFTIIRPGFLMANFLEPTINLYSEILEKGTWSTIFKADTSLGLVDHDDVAKLAVFAFQHPAAMSGRTIGLVSEFLTPQEILDHLSKAMGSPGFKAIFLTDEDLATLPPGSFDIPYVKGDKSFETMSDLVDMQELARLIPLTSFKKCLERENESVKKL